MSNKKDFATSTVLTAPSPADSGTSLVVQSGHGARFPAAPFYITAHPPSEFPTLDNAEKILVTAKSTDTFTIDRAEGDTAAQDIEAGWRVSNALFLDDIPDTFDDLADGSTNKAYTSSEKTKLSGIETAADVTDAGNVGSSIHGATGKTTPVDADTMPLIDSAASNVLKKVTWANIKATLVTYFDTLYSAVSHTHAFSALTSKPTTLSGYGITDAQALDSDLTTIAGLTATTDNFIQAKSSAWASRTPAQVAADLKAEVGKLLYPIGSIYTNATDNTNPGTLLGFGTWSAFAAGRVPLGVGTDSQVFTISSVDTGAAEAVTVASNNTIYTGTPVLYATSSGAIGGLTTATTYYAIRNSATSFSLATSLANALAGTMINLTSAGSGTQTLTVSGTARAGGDLVGEEVHGLTINELASHTHAITRVASQSNIASPGYGSSLVWFGDGSPGTGAALATGGSANHNNMQPSVAVYMWRRTA